MFDIILQYFVYIIVNCDLCIRLSAISLLTKPYYYRESLDNFTPVKLQENNADIANRCQMI